jgi:hypothetical protein
MNSTARFICKCGGVAADIKSELGAKASMRKVRPREAVGSYGDFIFESSDAHAVLMKMKYPKVVRII